jgi:hypothetical protein
MSQESNSNRWLSTGATVCVLLASFGAIAVTFTRMRGGVPHVLPAHAAGRGQETAPAPAERPALGSIVRLQPHAGRPVWLAADAGAWAALRRAQAVRDGMGIGRLVQAGAAFTVDDETQAKIVDESPGHYRVRVLEGDAQGRMGWVPMDNAEGLPQRRGF